MADQPGGLRHILVNGQLIRTDDRPLDDAPLAGTILEPKRYDR